MKVPGVFFHCNGGFEQVGYAVLPGGPIRIPVRFKRDWKAFRESWEHLPVDSFVPDSYRFRRYSRLLYCARKGRIERLPHRSFLQSADRNRLYGGVSRRFAAVRPKEIRSPVLRALIAIDLSCFGISAAVGPQWFVGVHQIRVVARRGQPGKPTPEGIHQDGCSFIGIHLVGRRNVRGGYTRVYANDHSRPFVTCLRDPLDSLIVDDTRVKHAVSPIHPLNAKAPGVRDILVLTYDVAT